MTAQLATFHVDTMHLGVDVASVQEVIRHQATTPVPMAPEVIRGLINLRGEIVTAIDLPRRLGAAADADGPEMSVVVRRADEAVCLLVDAIGDVVTPPSDSFEPPPDTVPPATRDLIRGAYKLDDGLLLLLDIDRALDVT